MLSRHLSFAVILASASFIVGCANDADLGGNLATSSVGKGAGLQTVQTDPACVSLATEIDTLRKDGIADKIEKAAAKKHKMTTAELVKADQLNKANAQFQAKCSTLPPKPATAQSAAAPAAQVATTAPKQ